ncbi:glycoside hydrolase family 3 C-terminal domain-containing protein [Gammaproteobacteria bacterium]|nr:glycoside hydrolase family 3 C-terminal domain-containing protein [Gammaproteobacteria bacterium]
MDRIEALIKELTLEEKVSIISGSDAWHSTGVERLSLPRIKMTDGPIGARGDSASGASAACFPSASSLSSTWDLESIEEIGKAIGKESKSKDADVLLGPTINLHRHPLGGRHFECYSEDPTLTGKLAVSYVKGIQSKGVSACLKHFVGNDTEFQRHFVSSNISARVLREMYLLPFEMGVKEGGALSVMSAYNQLNNTFCSSDKDLLINILKEEWNFPGFVVSDWGAALDTIGNANGGLDLEMPGPAKSWGENLVKAVEDSKVDEDIVDDKVRRILRVAEFTGRLDNPQENPELSLDLPEDRALIRKNASEGMVLLKNNDLLPLEKDNIKKLAVIGPNAKKGQYLGGGSASLKAHYVVHPLEGIQNSVDSYTEVSYAQGCHTHKFLPAIDIDSLSTDGDKSGFKVEFYENQDFNADPVVTDHMTGSKFWALGGFGLDVISKMEKPALSVRFSGKFTASISGSHDFEIYSIGPSRMKLNGEIIIDNWTEQEPGETFFSMGSAPKRSSQELNKDEIYDLEVEYQWSGRFPAIGIGMLPPDPLDLMEEATELAASSDAVILIVGTNSDWETEGNDRATLELPNRQNELIEKVCQANPKTVVVMNTGAPCTMPWHEKTEAILQCWFPGQEFGNSLSDIIFGDINPSGKLPTTFPKQIEDTPAFAHYPGENLQMDYLEGLYIGYRWYEKENIEPLFPFGHGLSYTEFSYSNLRVVPPKGSGSVVAFEVEVSNTGDRVGKEIIQCYVGLENSNVDRPIKELKTFKKIELKPSESKVCSFELSEKDLSYWDEQDGCWKVESNEYTISVGKSSADIELQTSVWLG